jgi:colanic acid/amylovoran biosynthesis glycosyltransferase
VTSPPAGGSAGRRVAVFRETFLPRSETFIRDHLMRLDSWSAVALTMRRDQDGLDVPGVPVCNAGQPRGSVLASRIVARALGARGERLNDIVLSRILGRLGVRLVHAHFGPDGAVVRKAAALANLPLVVTFHGYDATIRADEMRQSLSGQLLVRDWSRLTTGAAAIVTVSDFLRRELVARGVDPDRIRVVPCGVDSGLFSWSPPPAGGGVLFVGRLVEKKGCDDLLAAVARLPSSPRVRIVGDGPLRSGLERRARELRVNAEFLGLRSSDQVRRLIREASVVAMPSKRAANGDCEGLPVTSLEAGASGRPVAGYRHSGLVESVVHGETGLLANEGDVAGLSRNLEGLLGDRVELERLGRNGRDHVKRNFELRDCLRRIEDVYEAVVAQRR